MPCSLRARGYGRSAEPVVCASRSACPTPATLPCPKIPKHPGISRCCTPSRSLYWFARKRTSACETVSRTVPTSHTSFGHRSLGQGLVVQDGGVGTELHRSALPQWISGSGVGGPDSRKSKSHPSLAWVMCLRYSAP